MRKLNSYKNKKVLVFGLGKSGLAAANLLSRVGALVMVSESKPRHEILETLKKLHSSVTWEAGSTHFLKGTYDLVVASPGISWQHPALVRFRKNKIPVISELELGWQFINPKKTIAVTGTNGKTTTTALIGHILSSAGLRTVVGGNIGTPLSDLVNQIDKKTFLVLEVSSYQLEGIDKFHPNIGVLMNLTPDHLARHKTMEGYAKAKARMFKNFSHSDTIVFNKLDPWCRRIIHNQSGKRVGFPSQPLNLLAQAIQLKGQHNIENAMAAAAAALAIGISTKKIRHALETFKGVSHRLEAIRSLKGVMYVNDSKATNVDSTAVAIKSFDCPLILIMGGEHKGSSYKPLLPLMRGKVKLVLTLGQAAPLIERDFKNRVPVIRCHTLSRAIGVAFKNAVKPDVVLLSPACASFDQFKNFEHRGNVFRSLVNKL